MKKRLMSVVLAMAMIVSMIPATFAAEAGETKYVSLGDSMTNGYGLDGYDGSAGVEDYGDMSYANQFADYLGATEHAQLAMSAIRAEDLHWLLELDYNDPEAIALTEMGSWDEEAWYTKFSTGDYWTWNEICTHGRTKDAFDKIKTALGSDFAEFAPETYVSEYNGDVAVIAKYYQESVKNGDVISLGIGNGNFGVFMFGRIMEAIGFQGEPAEAMLYDVDRALAECDPEVREAALALEAELYAAAEGYLAGFEADAAEALLNTAVYTCVSYALNYAGTVEAIVELNPDADVILLALMNTFADAQGVESEDITLGDLLTAVYTPLNAFIAGLPAVMQVAGKYEQADFFYAEAQDVECLVEDYEYNIANGIGVTRLRFVESIVGGGSGMIWGLLNGALAEAHITVPPISLTDIIAFEAALASQHPTEGACTLPNCDLAAGAYHTALALLNAGMINATINPFDDPAFTLVSFDKALACALYLGFEKAIITASTAPVTLDSVLGLGDLTSEDEDEDENGGMFDGVMTALAPIMAAPSLDALVTLPEVLSATLADDPALNGLLGLFGRCVIGNGLGGHPSEDGHDTLTKAIADAYTGNHTAMDETVENLKVIAALAAELVAEYYDEAYAYAYEYAEENGYIDAAEKAIDDAIAMFEAIDLSVAEMTAEVRAEVEKQIEKIIETLETAKALIVEAHELGEATLANLLALLEQAGEDAWELVLTLEQAGIDAHQSVINELKNAHNYLTNEAIPEIDRQLQAAVIAGAEWLQEQIGNTAEALVELVIEALPGVDADLYDWLYNNPDKVIAFFAEYGDEIVELTEEYGEAALGIIAYVAFVYGDEVVDFVINNPEESLEMLVKWYDKYGYRVWPMVDKYLEELGVYDNIEDAFANLDNVMIALGAQIEKQIEEQIEAIVDQLEAQLETLKTQLENLNADLEAKLEQLKNASEEAKAEIEAAIAEIEAAIAEIEKAIAEIEAKIEELIQIAKDINEAIEDIIDAIQMFGEEQIEVAIEALQDALEKLADAVDALKDFVAEVNATIDAIQDTVKEIIAGLEKVDQFVSDTIETLKQVEKALADAAAAIKELAAALEEVYNTLLKNIVTANAAILSKCVIGEEIDYVALGGATVANENYADAVAQAIEAATGIDVNSYAYGVADLTYKTQLEYILANAEAIAGAELVSYQQDANEVVFALLDVVQAINLGGEYIAPDWSEYVDFETVAEIEAKVTETKAELLPYLSAETIEWIANAEAEMTAMLAEQVDAEIAEQLKPYVEQLVYSLVSYAVETAEAVEAIKTINADATVMLVGMYNMLDGVMVKMNGEETDLGEYFDYVMTAVDTYNMIYAVVSGNVTIVDVSEASVDGAVIDVDAMMALIAQLEMMKAEIEELLKTDDIFAVVDQINALNEKINYMVAQLNAASDNLKAILASTANDDGLAYIAEQIASVVIVTEHVWNEGEVTIVPVFGVPGEMTYTCVICGETRTEPIIVIVDGLRMNKGTTSLTVGGAETLIVTVTPDNTTYPAVTWTSSNPAVATVDENGRVNAIAVGTATITASVDGGPFGILSVSCDVTVTAAGGSGGSGGAGGAGGAVEVENPFIDVAESDYFYDSVMWAVENGVTAGTSKNTFSPFNICTRAEAVTFLWKAAGAPTPKTSVMPFADVPADAFYYNAVLWAVENGITAGTSETTFSPMLICSRAQLLTFVWRFANDPAAKTIAPFVDVVADDYFYVPVMWGYENGITAGTSATTFGPHDDCQRAQIVTFLWQYFVNVK